MSYRETEHLRVLIANERKDRLALVAPIVVSLGHEVIAREVDVADVGEVTARERPDVALVGLGESSDHALSLIERIVREAACPVIALIHAPDRNFVKEASKRGIFAYITDADGEDWQSSIDIVLRRFAEYHDLEGAFGRRAVTERAKGVLMERHSVDEEAAFEMLRDRARAANRKLFDVATAVVDGHLLLPKQPRAGAARGGTGPARTTRDGVECGRESRYGGKRCWFVPDGFLPARSIGGFESHEAACLLNAGDRPAQVRFHFFFEDREPLGPVELVLGPRRTRHVRLDDPAALGGLELPRDVPYAYTVESDVPVVLQHSRLDTSGGYTLFTSIAYGE